MLYHVVLNTYISTISANTCDILTQLKVLLCDILIQLKVLS